MDQTGLMFPKSGKKKKQNKHSKSIMHRKETRTCFLCALMDDNWGEKTYLEEHHVIPGNPGRQLSEEYGLKVYLCPNHHRTGENAVHNNALIMKRLQASGQQAFEETYPGLNWMDIFGKDYKEAYEMAKNEKSLIQQLREKHCKQIESVGTFAVMVGTGCPKAHIIKGVLCVSKVKCANCKGV